MSENPIPRKRKNTCLWIILTVVGGIALLTVICLAVGVLLNPTNPTPGTTSLPIQVCIGWSTMPKAQIGIAWASPIISYRPPIMASPTTVCSNIPYLGTLLSQRPVGQIAFPP